MMGGRLVAMLVMLLPLLALGGDLYRYHDAEGVLVINHTLPAKYAGQGYEILNRKGQLIEVVPPFQPLPESEDASGRLTGDNQAAIDRMLRTSYSTVEQVREAGARRLEQIVHQTQLIEAGLAQTLSAINRERERAARYEQAGREIPGTILENLMTLRAQRDSAEHLLRIRAEERNAVERQYQEYAERFAQLADEG